MPKPTKGPRLGGGPAHERLLLANLASALFIHKRITTTETKAKRVQPLAEQLITKAKRGDLHNRRLVLSKLTNKSVVHVLFDEIAPRFADRNGGYTRITKIGNRQGDNAPMAVIEIVTESVEESRKAKEKARAARPGAKEAAKPAKKAAKGESKPAKAVEEEVVETPAEETSPESPESPESAPSADSAEETEA